MIITKKTNMVVVMLGFSLLVLSFAVGADKNKGKKKTTYSTEPLIMRHDVIWDCIKTLKTIKTDTKVVSKEQKRAIDILCVYRSRESEAVTQLLRIIKIKSPKREIGRLQPPSDPLSLDNLPAALALYNIGLPAVHAIRDDLEETSNWKLDKVRLELYAKILFKILRPSHVRDYMLEEKKRAVKGSEKNYDRLLARPQMNITKPEGRRMTLEEMEEIRKKLIKKGIIPPHKR